MISIYSEDSYCKEWKGFSYFEQMEIHSFFYKNLFYKNVEAEIDPNFKNVLRTFLRLRVD